MQTNNNDELKEEVESLEAEARVLEKEVRVASDRLSKNVLVLSVAIVLAGAFIGGGLFLSGGVASVPDSVKSVSNITGADYVRGAKNAPVRIIEFSDLECPYCKNFHQTMNRIIAEYGPTNQVAWVYRHFPLSSHSKAVPEAHAAECAGELGGNDKFWEYIDVVFDITPSNNGLDLSLLPKIASDIGLDAALFQQCMDSNKYLEKITAAAEEAVNAGAEGTPYSVVIYGRNERLAIPGALPYETIKQLIDQTLNK